jgi:hypothetical protein
MNIGPNRTFAVFLSLLALFASGVAEAGGLSTQLGEVVIENLQIGQSYDLKQLANLSLIVTNTSDFGVNLKMDILQPDSAELRLGSQQIPDTSWVDLSQDFFTLGAGEQAESKITLSIPEDEKYLGKKYQVNIWSHTLGGENSGMFLAYGLKTRIIFTTDTVKADQGELITSSGATVNFTLKPEEIFLEGVTPGTLYDISQNNGITLEVFNPGDRKQAFKLQSLTVENSVASLTKEYQDAPDASFLKFSESSFVIPPKGTKTIKMYLEFPANKDFSGKKYMFVIHAVALDEKVTAGVYSRLYATVQ